MPSKRKERKKREKKREKKKEKKRFPIKDGKLKQVGNENFSPQGWKNGKIEFVAQEMTSKEEFFKNNETMKQAKEVSVQRF